VLPPEGYTSTVFSGNGGLSYLLRIKIKILSNLSCDILLVPLLKLILEKTFHYPHIVTLVLNPTYTVPQTAATVHLATEDFAIKKILDLFGEIRQEAYNQGLEAGR